jgi:hypothetical protein
MMAVDEHEAEEEKEEVEREEKDALHAVGDADAVGGCGAGDESEMALDEWGVGAGGSDSSNETSVDEWTAEAAAEADTADDSHSDMVDRDSNCARESRG